MSEHRPEQDPEILFPDETLRIAGEEIRVREFRYAEGLRAIALGRPILAALRQHLEDDDFAPEVLDGVIAEHHQAWLQLIAMSVGKEVAWVERLADADGLSLSMAFWRVNSAFFMRRLVLAGGLAGGIKGLVESLSPLAEIFDALVSGGYGRDPAELAERLTWRQIQRFFQLCQRRRNEHRADLIEAAAVAWSGNPTDRIEKLRNREST